MRVRIRIVKPQFDFSRPWSPTLVQLPGERHETYFVEAIAVSDLLEPSDYRHLLTPEVRARLEAREGK